MTLPQAVVLERNKLVNRRICRVLGCAGFDVRGFEEPEKVDAQMLGDPSLMVGDTFDCDLVLRWLRERQSARAILYTGEPLDRLLAKALEEPRLTALVGRPSFEVPPRETRRSKRTWRGARPASRTRSPTRPSATEP